MAGSTRLAMKVKKQISRQSCTICLEYLGKDSISICCGVKCHSKCLQSWIRITRKCPICKEPIEKDDCDDEDYVEVEKSLKENVDRIIKHERKTHNSTREP